MRQSEVHWFVLLQHPLSDLSCFSSSRGFMAEGHYAWPPNLADNLLMRFITFGLLWYFDIFAGFWVTSWKATITSGSCMAARTSGSLRISLSRGFPGIPGMPPPIRGISPGKLPGIPPGKPPGKQPCWEPDCLLASSSHWALSCSSRAFLTLSTLSFILGSSRFHSSLSPRFSNFLGPGLNFFQHCTSIFIIIQLTGKGKIMGSFFPMAQKSVCFPLPLVWLSWIRIYFNSFVSLGWQHLTSVIWWRRWLSWHTELPNEDLAWWHLWSSQWLSGVHHHVGHQWQPLLLSFAWSIISSVISTFSSPISWGASASGSITFIVNF